MEYAISKKKIFTNICIMDIRAELLKEHSRAQANRVAKWVGNSPERLTQLIDLFLHDEYRVVQRAARVVSLIADEHFELVKPHLPALVKRMNEPNASAAVKRNVVRIFQFVDIPEALHGDVMNSCFDLLANPNENIAERVFSMSVLANLAQHYPDIKPELKAIIEDALQHQPSAGFRSRAAKVLKLLSK
jgi:hypothetical protein